MCQNYGFLAQPRAIIARFWHDNENRLMLRIFNPCMSRFLFGLNNHRYYHSDEDNSRVRIVTVLQGQKDLKKQFRLLPCFIACFCVVFGTLCNVIRTAEQSITKPECPNLRQILDRYSLLCNHPPIWFITFIRSSEKGEYFFHLYKTLFLIAHNFLHTILTI